MHQLSILSCLPLLTALAFLFFGNISQVFRVYVLVHEIRYCLVRSIAFIVVPCMSVWPVLFCGTGWM